MFHSSSRPLIIPQSEHQRLAGTLASAWGNDAFDLPPLPFASFVQGVALHDWHYGLIDNLSITGASDADWLAMVTKGVHLRFDDPVVDLVTRLHIRRLLLGTPTPERRALAEQAEERIQARLGETGRTRAEFEWADHITRCCDHLAFDFCLDHPAEGVMKVCARVGSDQETEIRYRVAPDGIIHLRPWPFALPALSGILTAYRAGGYPDTLVPEILPFRVEPGV